ncbi:ZapG family protein [Psychrosphaera haliotis]|uniref:DUF1043 family protein n=1 Tax=Psychrosphaera haliotis TaxID=555083 RepID=A0A6N8FCZ9_9GAMM|nr:DUF1043 family protein [Psychrosphaera haliotis]MDB2373037.1 YhcB family protein [Psychrosphaera haliotis]MUH72612.1 DUF1043 family protein [Psychrosphaera haliotis]
MEIINGFIFFLVGVLAGIAFMIIRSKFSPGSNEVKTQLELYKQDNAQLKQEWQDQLVTYKTISSQLNELSTQIDQQVGDANQILHKAPANNAFPFFSNEATEFLKTTTPEKREKVNLSDQPLDYSNAGSGVFKGVTPENTVEKNH